jgi:hypothetical protein
LAKEAAELREDQEDDVAFLSMVDGTILTGSSEKTRKTISHSFPWLTASF